MLAQIRNLFRSRAARLIVLAISAFALPSCATKQEPQLIADSTGRESSLPWNKQEKWENTGQLGGMADPFQSR